MQKNIENEEQNEEILNEYEFFPNDQSKLDYVISIYEQEILNRHKWIIDSVKLINEALNESSSAKRSSASTVINYAMNVINHAMLVLRLVDLEAKGSWNKKRSKERARILHIRNNNFIEPPESLRDIRNDYEHFEDRLDQWATKENPNMYIDLNIGANIIGGDINQTDVFRNLNGAKLTFWNEEIDLQEVVDWIGRMAGVIIENNPDRYRHYEF